MRQKRVRYTVEFLNQDNQWRTRYFDKYKAARKFYKRCLVANLYQWYGLEDICIANKDTIVC